MKKIAVVTTTRAEYGILTPLIKKIDNESDLELCLIVSGTHLSEEYGNTINFIKEDGFRIFDVVPIIDKVKSETIMSDLISNSINKFTELFQKTSFDLVVLLGDRVETLGIAIAAMTEKIPIAHIHGGELTEGAIDDAVRHSITKMSLLHFPSCEIYRKRIIQLGESPDRVFNVGALSTENILGEQLFNESEIKEFLSIDKEKPYAMVTYHPVTLENNTGVGQVRNIINAIEKFENINFIFTQPNIDKGGDEINKLIAESAKKNSNIKLFKSLGMKKYLSALKYASFILGNSSSGVIEAPVLGCPAINIGDRQKGRIKSELTIDSMPITDDIERCIKKALELEHKQSYIFGNGNTSSKIVENIKEFFDTKGTNLKKTFYDVNFKL